MTRELTHRLQGASQSYGVNPLLLRPSADSLVKCGAQQPTIVNSLGAAVEINYRPQGREAIRTVLDIVSLS